MLVYPNNQNTHKKIILKKNQKHCLSTIPNHPKDGDKDCNFASRRFMNSNVNYIKKIAFNNGNFMRLVLFCREKKFIVQL